MRRIVFFFASAALLALAAPVQADVSDYLTADGKLKSTLVLKQVQGGFAGFTGTQYTIEPDGKWRHESVFNEKLKPIADGQLGKEKLERLAGEFDKFKMNTLKTEGKVMVNPSVVTISFGSLKAELNQMAGAGVPKPDETTNAGRFGGVWSVVQKATGTK
jgi:hypothetical protein